MALLIPILGVIFAIGFPLAIPIILIVLRYRRRKRAIELHHAERMAAIERGMEIPPIPLDVDPPRPPQTGLQRGLICTFVGVALASSWLFSHEEVLMIAGLIVGGIGIAYLIYYAVEGRKLLHRSPVPVARSEELR